MSYHSIFIGTKTPQYGRQRGRLPTSLRLRNRLNFLPPEYFFPSIMTFQQLPTWLNHFQGIQVAFVSRVPPRNQAVRAYHSAAKVSFFGHASLKLPAKAQT